MQAELIKSESSFSFILDGNNEMDANLLAEALSSFAALSRSAGAMIDPSAIINVKVQALKSGSFEVDFTAICDIAKTMLITVPAMLSTAKLITDVIKGFFEVKKHAAGERPKSVERDDAGYVEVTNSDGLALKFPANSEKVLESPLINDLVRRIVMCAEENRNNGFRIKTTDGKVFRCEADEYEYIAAPIEVPDAPMATYSCRATLPIRSAVFMDNSQWSFKFQGRTIRASINDKGWMDKFRAGEIGIRPGDCLDATLEINANIDDGGSYLVGTEKYEVRTVHNIIMRETAIQPNFLN